MMVLAGEVYYYKKKTKKEEAAKKNPKFRHQIQPLENFEYSDNVSKNSVLLGPGTFVPAANGNKRPRLSIISMNPRDWTRNKINSSDA